MSSSLTSGEYRRSLLFSRSLSCRALSTHASVSVFLASPSRGGSRTAVVEDYFVLEHSQVAVYLILLLLFPWFHLLP
jgi:hypothetical protein